MKSSTQRALDSVSTPEITQATDKVKLGQLRKHIEHFFAKYPKFNYDPTKPYTEEFIRMTEEFGWPENSKEYKNTRKKLNTASVLQFNENFDKEFKSGGKRKPKLEGKKKESKSGGKKNKSESGDKKEGKDLRKWIKLFNRIDIKDPVMPKTIRGFEKHWEDIPSEPSIGGDLAPAPTAAYHISITNPQKSKLLPPDVASGHVLAVIGLKFH
ncbi:hypothetical protein FRC11_008495 [Ceratobasidium sp. 423]|nr:hypothetical protein FRC11_008495 [Ceratobasidium sp. 423]